MQLISFIKYKNSKKKEYKVLLKGIKLTFINGETYHIHEGKAQCHKHTNSS